MLQCDDDNRDDEGPSNTLEYFNELEQVLQMIEFMQPIDHKSFEMNFEKYTEILTRYQDQPHLLDPHLTELLTLLLHKVRDRNSSEALQHAAFKYLYIISKVRTYKALIKFLPHELSDLEFALELLEKQDPKETNHWETRYILLLWLSILVLNPFHMSRLDAFETGSNSLSNNTSNVKTKMERIYDLCTVYTAANDTCSNISAYLSAKYLIRADILNTFLEKYIAFVVLQSSYSNIKLGQLAAIAAILKHGKREDLLPYADKLLPWIMSCNYKQSTEFSQYKLCTKIIQRVGLVYLKPRIASWRYNRGTRSLATNLNHPDESHNNSRENAAGSSTSETYDTAEDGDEIIVPDAVEDVIEELLQALRSGAGDIRWNAAKGIGRVTNRLPKELADEVIGSVIDMLSPLEPHEAWHGACLALAELAKRGLLLPYRLATLVPLLMKALFYDEMKGYMSVGSHIRDAACYMCWAFARAYNPDDLQPFVQYISSGLLTVAVFDREVNCRRAASAAFQESVGRLGNFPYGIEISTTTDFYSVGLRQNAYIHISCLIAQYTEYRKPLIDHLVEYKISHWDTAIRELTAKALHKLTYCAPEYMAEAILKKLFGKISSIDINTRHGTVLAIGEITLALRKIENERQHDTQYKGNTLISNQTVSDIGDLTVKFLKRDLFRGMSGEIMKQCCTDFIKNCCLAKIEVNNYCLDSWQQIINKCLLNKTAPIREAATSALLELCRAYYDKPERQTDNSEIVKFYLDGANNDLEEHIRMGYVCALGALPAFMIRPYLNEILDNLITHSLTPLQAVIVGELTSDRHESTITHLWSEARRDSVKALCQVVQTVGYDTEDSFNNRNRFDKVMECLLKTLDEYTLDNRGDIGAWVREAAMLACHKILTTCPHELLRQNHVHKIICGFMQQAVEKIDRTRAIAGRLLSSLIHSQPEIPFIKSHNEIKAVLPADETSIMWSSASETFPVFCELLKLPEYSKRVLLGLSASIGQLTESLIKYSSAALFQFLRTHSIEVPRICQEIVEIFEENLLNERVTYTMLSFLDILMSSGTISSVMLDPSNTFADDILRLVNHEVKGYKKLYKLTSSINVYCQLIQVPRLYKKVVSKMSIFLGLTHVHVRKTTATKLYEALALHGDNCNIPEDKLDEILNLLSETDWSLPLVEVRPIRNELCDLMGIKSPVSNVMATASTATTGGSASYTHIKKF